MNPRAGAMRAYVTGVALWSAATGMQSVLFSWLVVGELSAAPEVVGLVQMAHVAPLLVLLSLFLAPQQLTLAFGRAEVWALFIAVLIGAVIANDGRSNWYKGVQLVTVYAIMAVVFYILPETP